MLTRKTASAPTSFAASCSAARTTHPRAGASRLFFGLAFQQQALGRLERLGAAEHHHHVARLERPGLVGIEVGPLAAAPDAADLDAELLQAEITQLLAGGVIALVHRHRVQARG